MRRTPICLELVPISLGSVFVPLHSFILIFVARKSLLHLGSLLLPVFSNFVRPEAFRSLPERIATSGVIIACLGLIPLSTRLVPVFSLLDLQLLLFLVT